MNIAKDETCSDEYAHKWMFNMLNERNQQYIFGISQALFFTQQLEAKSAAVIKGGDDYGSKNQK